MHSRAVTWAGSVLTFPWEIRSLKKPSKRGLIFTKAKDIMHASKNEGT